MCQNWFYIKRCWSFEFVKISFMYKISGTDSIRLSEPLIGMGLGRIFAAQGQFGPISFGPAQGLGRFWNLTFGPGPGLDFLALGWAGPWAR